MQSLPHNPVSRVNPGLLQMLLDRLLHVPAGNRLSWKKKKATTLMLLRRVQRGLAVPFFIGKAQVLLKQGQFQQAARLILACAPKIICVVKDKSLCYSRPSTILLCSDGVNVAATMLFRSITEPSSVSLSQEMCDMIIARFSYCFGRINDLKLLRRLHDPDDAARSLAEIEAKSHKFASHEILCLCKALVYQKRNKFPQALLEYSRCQGITKQFAKFQITCLILDGKADNSFTRDQGENELVKMKDKGYRPAIKYWLDILLFKANTPESIRDAFGELYQCTGWKEVYPSLQGKLLAKLNQQIKQLHKKCEKWEKAYAEQVERMFLYALNALDEKSPSSSQIDDTSARVTSRQKSVASHQKDLAEARRIYDEHRRLYDAERKAERKAAKKAKIGEKRDRM